MQLGKVKLVMDRGFYSEDNNNALYYKHYKFLILGKISLKFIQKKLDEVREIMTSRPNYSTKYRLSYHSSIIDWKYSETKKRSITVETGECRMYHYPYHNDQIATDDKSEFNELLDCLEDVHYPGNDIQNLGSCIASTLKSTRRLFVVCC